jgi:hypothetical protein
MIWPFSTFISCHSLPPIHFFHDSSLLVLNTDPLTVPYSVPGMSLPSSYGSPIILRSECKCFSLERSFLVKIVP